MGRRAKCPKGKREPKRSPARKLPKNEGAQVRDLEKRLAEAVEQLQARDHELAEAQEQQTATSEILKVIASSPTDTQPVLDAIAENAARLCSVEDVFIVLVAGDALRAVAATGQLIGSIPDYNARRVPVSRTSVAGRVIVDRTTMQIDDLAAVSEDELPDGRALQRMFNHRTILATPLLREGAALGAIVVFRLEVRPFSERQQYLLQTFADQAVIAIENVRLFTELQESNRELTSALDTQTATSDILRVISRSPTDVQPVFDAIVHSAVRLLQGHTGLLTQVVRDRIELGALTSSDAAADAFVKASFPGRSTTRGGTLASSARVSRSTSPTPRRISGRARSSVRSPVPVATGAGPVCPCSDTARRSEPSRSRAASRAASPTTRSRCSRPSPTRR